MSVGLSGAKTFFGRFSFAASAIRPSEREGAAEQEEIAEYPISGEEGRDSNAQSASNNGGLVKSQKRTDSSEVDWQRLRWANWSR